MENNLFTIPGTKARCGVVPRDYQNGAHDHTFRLFDEGIIGALERMFTGAGKTLTACLIADTWLQRSAAHHVMVVSYEKQLVSQFAQEIEDYLGIEPGIEMEAQRISPDAIPRIVVASRATLLRTPAPEPEQVEELAKFGVFDLLATTKDTAKIYLGHLRRGGDVQSVLEDIFAKSSEPEADGKNWSRLHKFRHEFPWLVIFDEAHRHCYSLKSVGHIVDWFERNPQHRRIGLTATPIVSSGKSLGHKMFPGIAIDYPLFAKGKPCAIQDGWAVPYLQRYIEVEGVDFRAIARVSEGGDFDEAALELELNKEERLAKLIEPLLDLVGDRRTLIFSPGVDMAKNVARYINARVQARCECGLVRWYPRGLIDDGACCTCGRFIERAQVTKKDEQARELDGAISMKDRRPVYEAHQTGKFQFLSVCGLCREGYNDPDIACVAVFRPVSKKARGLAEQMKGRACRPLRSVANILHTLPTAEARRAAIAASEKPNALIVDLVGITGLADCASTVDIYAEGLPDEIRDRAAQILATTAQEEEVGVEEAIEQAQQEAEEAAQKLKEEREEAERRAQQEADRRSQAYAQTRYTAHEVGHGSSVNPGEASDKQIKFIGGLGMALNEVILSSRMAGRMIGMLKRRIAPEEVARQCGLREEQWKIQGPSPGQANFMRYLGISHPACKTGYDANQMITAKKEPHVFEERKSEEIQKAKNGGELDAVRMDMELVRKILPHEIWDRLCALGKQKRQAFAAAPSSSYEADRGTFYHDLPE